MTVTRRRTTWFLLATFVWTWTCYGALIWSGHSPYEMPWMLWLIAGGMGPSLVGVVLTLLGDPADRQDFWRRARGLSTISAGWWLFILLIFPLVFAAAIAFDLALGGTRPGLDQWRALMTSPALWPLVTFISFLSGPWSEEFGWRGYLLDPLLARFGRVRGSIVLGLIWGVWHLPLYGMPATWHGHMGFRLEGFWTFMLLNIGLSLMMTRVHLATGGSIPAAMFIHFAANFTAQLVAPVSDRVEVARTCLILAVAVVVWYVPGRGGAWAAAAQPIAAQKLERVDS